MIATRNRLPCRTASLGGLCQHSITPMTTNRSSPPNDPPSPCVGVCVISPKTQWCEGCYRTLDEIAGWWDYNPHQKSMVLAQLDDRLAHIMGEAVD